MQNKIQRPIALLLCVLMFAVSFAACGQSDSSDQSGSSSTGEGKSFTLVVTHGDGSVKNFDLSSEKEMLGEALMDEELIQGEDGEFGLFVTTVDGETADSDSQQWWCLTIDGEMATTGVDTTPITEGASYELTLTVGY